MFIELHILQNFPPSNLNRDDVGQPKDGDFGGFRRARISSQCLKRSIRYAGKNLKDTSSKSVFERYTGIPLSIRTKMLSSELATQLMMNGKSESDASKVALEFAKVYSSKKGKMDQKKPSDTSTLIFMTQQELADITQQLLAIDWAELLPAIDAAKGKKSAKAKDENEQNEQDEEKATAKSPLKKMADTWSKLTEKRPSAPDISLFGRMLADNPDTDIDAACQVAHALSTHAVPKSEIDYYTAVDEVKQRNNEQGAGFLDVAYFNSACFYRYARIDVGQLTRNLGNDDTAQEVTKKAIEAFLRASEAAIPTGKKNSYAPECRPSFMLAVVRSDNSEGWSLVNAFETPVRPASEAGLVAESVKELCAEFDDHCDRYGAKSVVAKSVIVSRRASTAVTGRLASAISKSESDDKSALDLWVQTTVDALKGV